MMAQPSASTAESTHKSAKRRNALDHLQPVRSERWDESECVRRAREEARSRVHDEDGMIEWIGFIGGALFAAGCIPMAFNTWIAGRDLGTPLSTQWLLFLACALYAIYLLGAFGFHWPFVFLLVEVFCWGVALTFHYFPREHVPDGRGTFACPICGVDTPHHH